MKNKIKACAFFLAGVVSTIAFIAILGFLVPHFRKDNIDKDIKTTEPINSDPVNIRDCLSKDGKQGLTFQYLAEHGVHIDVIDEDSFILNVDCRYDGSSTFYIGGKWAGDRHELHLSPEFSNYSVDISPDHKYLEVWSGYEGITGFDIVEIGPIYFKNQYKPLLRMTSYTYHFAVKEWGNGKVIIATDTLLKLSTDDDRYLSEVDYFHYGVFEERDIWHEYSFNLKTGEVIPLTDIAKDPENYFLRFLKSEDAYLRGRAAEFLAKLNSRLISSNAQRGARD